MIEAIMSSKLYKNSARQRSILAAMQDPLNTELVQQLKEYLEDSDELDESVTVTHEEKTKESSDVPSKSSKTSSFPQAKFTPSTSADNSPEPDESIEDSTESESSEGAETKTDQSDDVDSSVDVKASLNVFSDVEIMKGTLNSRDDTSGVTRILYKDKELHIYYKDTINLNTKMEAVVDFMNLNYPYLEFNRLVRTQNSIVFEANGPVTIDDTPSLSDET